MKFTTLNKLLFLSASVVAVFGASVPDLERRISDPNNPADLINCPPFGGADDCHLETPCSRIRLNYGSTQQGHYIWYQYDITDIPNGVEIEDEDSCTNY